LGICQKHFLCTIPGPLSSYSYVDIHIFWKVLSDASIDPPIQGEYFLSGGANSVSGYCFGFIASSSLLNLSTKPSNKLHPPTSITLFHCVCGSSTDLNNEFTDSNNSCEKSDSADCHNSFCNLIYFPSGNLN